MARGHERCCGGGGGVVILKEKRFGSAKLNLKSEMSAILSRSAGDKEPLYPEESLECAHSLIAGVAVLLLAKRIQ